MKGLTALDESETGLEDEVEDSAGTEKSDFQRFKLFAACIQMDSRVNKLKKLFLYMNLENLQVLSRRNG